MVPMDTNRIPADARPADLVRLATDRWGRVEFVRRCVDLLLTMSWDDEPELLSYLGGPVRGPRFVELGVGKEGYWLRVWPLRALLYTWDDAAGGAVVAALADEHWRVREMAAKVAVRRGLAEAADPAARLAADPVVRVRAAAARVLAEVGEGEHAAALNRMSADPDPAVRRRAESGLDRMRERLDRPL